MIFCKNCCSKNLWRILRFTVKKYFKNLCPVWWIWIFEFSIHRIFIKNLQLEIFHYILGWVGNSWYIDEEWSNLILYHNHKIEIPNYLENVLERSPYDLMGEQIFSSYFIMYHRPSWIIYSKFFWKIMVFQKSHFWGYFQVLRFLGYCG